MILLLLVSQLLTAPPVHLTKRWSALSGSKKCALLLFYSNRLKRYSYRFTPKEKDRIAVCARQLFPTRINWFSSRKRLFRFAYPKNYIKSSKELVSIPAGYWWVGWVPSLLPLGKRYYAKCRTRGPQKPRKGYWIKLPSFSITYREISKKEYAKGKLGYPGAPKSGVSYTEAARFCARLGGALPSEEQWEVAANGGFAYRVFSWGESIPAACFGKTGEECGEKKRPRDLSRWGVRHMSSSLAEWVRPPKGFYVGHAIVKGGGDAALWYDNFVPSRRFHKKSHSSPHIGFRCVF